MPTITGDDGPARDGFDYEALARYFAGECDAAEARAIEGRIARDPELATEVERLRAVWTAGAGPQPDVEAALRRVMQPVERRASTPELQIVRNTRKTPVGVPRARMPLARSGAEWLGRAAIAAGIVLAVGTTVVIVSRGGATAGTHVAVRDYVTGAGERLSVTLVDGTHFALAPESRLRVPVTYGRSSREVALDGEAFFTVVHDEARPFRVQARNADATDVGTAFDVRAYASDTAVQVAVAEGRVAVAAAPIRASEAPAREQRVASALGAGDVATVSGSGRIGTAHDVDLAPFIGWTRGELVFHDTPLREVMPELERWYGVTIVITDPALASRPIYATYRMQSVTEVLTLVTSTVGAHYTQQGRTITVGPGLASPR
jgi:transmembrane sensor